MVQVARGYAIKEGVYESAAENLEMRHGALRTDGDRENG